MSGSSMATFWSVAGAILIVVLWITDPTAKDRQRRQRERLEEAEAARLRRIERDHMRATRAADNLQREREKHQARQLAKEQGPAKYLCRWRIEYIGTGGEVTTRTIRVTAIRPNLQHIEAWCELRKEERTFSFAGLIEVIDMDGGEVIDFDSWLSSYRKSRRSPPRTSN